MWCVKLSLGPRGRLAILALCACSMICCAHLQPTKSWQELGRRLGPGKPVAVTDASGTETRGKVAAISDASLTLNVEGAPHLFDVKDVRQIRRDCDPLWNGLAAGAAVGGLGALLSDSRCSGRPATCDGRQIAERVAFIAVMTAAGIAVDALHRDRTVLYRAAGHVPPP